MNNKKINLTSLIFMALCCDIGIVAKKLISPAANVITESIHIPGGIATAFSLMFVIIGAFLCNFFGSAIMMCIVQSMIALIMGNTGSMGMLVVIAYIVPGIVIDLSILVWKHFVRSWTVECVAITNALAGLSAAVCANSLTFRLSGLPILIYFLVAFTMGYICGVLASILIKRLEPVIGIKFGKDLWHGCEICSTGICREVNK